MPLSTALTDTSLHESSFTGPGSPTHKASQLFFSLYDDRKRKVAIWGAVRREHLRENLCVSGRRGGGYLWFPETLTRQSLVSEAGSRQRQPYRLASLNLWRAPHAVGGTYGFRSARNACSRLQFVQTNISLCCPRVWAAGSISLSHSSPPHVQRNDGGGSTRGRI